MPAVARHRHNPRTPAACPPVRQWSTGNGRVDPIDGRESRSFVGSVPSRRESSCTGSTTRRHRSCKPENKGELVTVSHTVGQ